MSRFAEPTGLWQQGLEVTWEREQGKRWGSAAISQGKTFLTVSQAKAAEQTLLTKVCLTWKFQPARSQSKYQWKCQEELCSSIFRTVPGEEGTQLCPPWWGESRRRIRWHLTWTPSLLSSAFNTCSGKEVSESRGPPLRIGSYRKLQATRWEVEES